MKVTFTTRGDLDADAKFFAAGDVDKIVYCPTAASDKCRDRLGKVATVVDTGDSIDLGAVLADLADRAFDG